MEIGSLGITGVYNIEVGERQRSDVRALYEDTLNLSGLPDVCPDGQFSVSVGPLLSSVSGVLTFAGSGAAIRAITLAVPRGSLPAWRTKLLQRGTRVIGRAVQFEEEYLCFVDDSEFDLALTEIDVGNGSNASVDPDHVCGIHSIEIDSGPGDELERLLNASGLHAEREEGPVLRYRMRERGSGLAIDLFRSSMTSLKHELRLSSAQRMSFHVPDTPTLRNIEGRLRQAGFDPVPFCRMTDAFFVRLQSQPGLEIGFVRVGTSKPSLDIRDRVSPRQRNGAADGPQVGIAGAEAR